MVDVKENLEKTKRVKKVQYIQKRSVRVQSERAWRKEEVRWR